MNVTSKIYYSLFCVLLSLKIDYIFASEQREHYNDNYKNYLGTKTPYRIIANLNDSAINFEGA